MDNLKTRLLEISAKKKEIESRWLALLEDLEPYIKKYVARVEEMNKWCKENLPFNEFSYKPYKYHDFDFVNPDSYYCESIELRSDESIDVTIATRFRRETECNDLAISLNLLLNEELHINIIEKEKEKLLEEKNKTEQAVEEKRKKEKMDLYLSLKNEFENPPI